MTTTAAVLATTTWLTLRLFRSQLLEVTAQADSTESDALRIVLEEQMKAGDRKLLRQLVAGIGKEPGIMWVGILDHTGRLQISSDDTAIGQQFDVRSPDCQICHAREVPERKRSVTLARPDGEVLRTVTPLENRSDCHRCHGSERRINGMLIVDRSLDRIKSAVMSSQTEIVIGSLAALFALLASLGFAVERVVLLRVRRLRRATTDLGQGDLAARAADESRDELGDLARDFNSMAARLSRAMAELAAERRQLDELVNGIADGVAVIDTNLEVVTANRAFAQRFQRRVEDLSGAGYVDLVGAVAFAAPGRSPAERALSGGRLEKEIVRVAVPEGERFEEVYAQPLRGSDDAIVAVVDVWRDITDRKMLETGLEHSDRLAAIGTVASTVAHEVGNPMAAIATAVDGLLRQMDGPGGAQVAEIREYLEIIQKQVFRCRGVTERLLGFARLPSREVTTVDAAAAAREMLALVSPQARSQRVEIRASIAGPAAAIAEDLMLEQVFLNLVRNALAVMPSGGVLTVDVHAAGDHVCAVVSDTGPGIPEAGREQLFEPFRRGRPEGPGAGLGLFLCHTLVRRCGGTIEVASEPGKGATFTVRLRRAPEAGRPPAGSADPAAAGGNDIAPADRG